MISPPRLECDVRQSPPPPPPPPPKQAQAQAHAQARRSCGLVGGASNRVVEWHSLACQHCGDHSVAADKSCVACSISVHGTCVAFGRRSGGRCDVCVHEQLASSSSTCCLCKVPDPVIDRADSTDRLSKVVLCYGRTWQRRERPTEVDSLGASGYTRIVDDRIRPSPAVHDVSTLWEQGRVPMLVVDPEDDDAVLVSDPVVAHSWCVQCLFQVQVQSTQVALDELDAPTRLEGVPSSVLSLASRNVGRRHSAVATFETHACVFCGQRTGWTTFCFAHVASERGCELCTNAEGSATHAFHPSCAVYAGMQRTARLEGYGMLCAASSKWRDALFVGLESFLGYMSGVNWFVTGPASSMVPPCGTRLKGERYEAVVDVSSEQVELRRSLLVALDAADLPRDDADADELGLRRALLQALDADVALLPPKKRKWHDTSTPS